MKISKNNNKYKYTDVDSVLSQIDCMIGMQILSSSAGTPNAEGGFMGKVPMIRVVWRKKQHATREESPRRRRVGSTKEVSERVMFTRVLSALY